MEAQSVNSRANGRREPRWFTLADLLMLMVGFALAFSLPRLHHLDDPLFQLGAQSIPLPGFLAHFLVVREVAMKCGLIVVPVILARRARYGGLPHPAEWLAILIALPWLHEAAEACGVIQGFAMWYLADLRRWLGFPADASLEGWLIVGRAPSVEVVMNPGSAGGTGHLAWIDEHPIWCGFTAITFVGLSAALGFAWRWLSGWSRTTLLALVALAGLEAVVSYLLPLARFHATQIISRWFGSPLGIDRLIAPCVESSLDGVLLVVPFVAARLALRTSPRTFWTWTAWAGASAGLLALAADLAYTASPSPFGWEPVAWRRLAILSLRYVVAGLASAIIVRWPGRTRGSQPAAAGVEGAGH